MRLALFIAPWLMLSGCETTAVCSADEDCGELSYCYRALLENVDDEDAVNTPGYPYQESGTCRSDCTSDADCFNGARCTPKGICRDPREGGGVQWQGSEQGLSELLDAWEFAPLLDCKGYWNCLLTATSSDEHEACGLNIDPPAREAAGQLVDCLENNCPNADDWGACVASQGPCHEESLVCINQII